MIKKIHTVWHSIRELGIITKKLYVKGESKVSYIGELVLLLFLVLFIIIIAGLNIREILLFSGEEALTIRDVVVETCAGFIDIYSLTKNKRVLIKSYPIECVLIYDVELYNKKIILLNQIIFNKFRECSITYLAQTCQMWSMDSQPNRFDSGFLKGETFGGKFKNKNFKFIYFIQDADGHNLQKLYKIWPLLSDVVQTGSKKFKNAFYIEPLEAELRLGDEGFKIRKGTINDRTNNFDLAYKRRLENSQNMFIMHQGKDGYQVLVQEKSMEDYTKYKIIKK